MDYLAREDAPFSPELWQEIDNTVIENARKHMVCRRFLSVYGPLGVGTTSVNLDRGGKEEVLEDGFSYFTDREIIPLPQLYEDFGLLWRDFADAEKRGMPADLSAAAAAAQKSAKKEDHLLLSGNKKLGMEGIYTAAGTKEIKIADWSVGEDAYKAVAQGIAYMSSNNYLGRYALILSPEIYLDLERLQPSVGLLEIDRVAKLVNGKVYSAGTFGSGKAALVCAEPQYIDLAIGADLSVGYLEKRDFNHYLRIVETLALRIKEPKAIVSFVKK